jgi:hypothetical protein
MLAHRTDVRNQYDANPPAVSPDGRWLAGYPRDPGTDNAVELRPALGGRGSVRLPLAGDGWTHSVFTPDGQTLVTVTRKRPADQSAGGAPGPAAVRLWEVRTGRERLEVALAVSGKAGRLGPVTLAVSADGRFLAGEWTDANTIAVWDLATGAEVARRTGYGSSVQTLAFRPDGKALASGHADGTALVWDLSGLPGVTPAPADREAAWIDLASADAGRAHRAILALAADPGGAAFLRDRVRPATAVPAARLRKLVEDLDSDRYATREAATATLKGLGDAADSDLRAMLGGGLSAEQHRRLTAVLEGRELTESDPDRLRALRCVEVLERVGSAEADAVLRELAKGAPGARLTREAAAAVGRRGVSSR